MTAPLFVLDLLIRVLRPVVFGAAVLCLVVFAVDWLVRTRRINAFSPVARFFRRVVDPLIAPVERRVVRSGGLPSSAPWWALVVVVISGILLIVALQYLRDLVASAAFAAGLGARGVFYLLISWSFGLLRLALIVRVVASWLRLSEYAWWLRWAVILTEPILRPLRRFVPTLGMIDITPIVAWFLLTIAQSIVLRLV